MTPRGCSRAALAWMLLAAGPPLAVAQSHEFDAATDGEAVAIVRAAVPGCGWERPGAEAALLRVELDGKYSQHLPLVRGGDDGDYRIALGRVAAGRHALRFERDARSAPPCAPHVSGVTVDVIGPDRADFTAFSHAPVIHVRPGTVERFSDLPILAYVETRTSADGGAEYRYTVVFTNEDGGTPADRLMATWGRTTDIEFVYGVRLDARGHVVATEIQGPDHALLPFTGTREAGHPLLWVTTENNMVEASGTTGVRIAPAVERLDLRGRPRETIMDLHPWSYRVMAAELAREGKVAAGAAPGSGRVPPVGTFVYLEACPSLVNAALVLSVGTDDGAGATTWFDVDRGNPEFRLVRSGCSRVALPVPGEHRRIVAWRARAVERSRPEAEGPEATLRELSVLVPDARGEPAPLAPAWRGEERLAIDGQWLVVGLGR